MRHIYNEMREAILAFLEERDGGNCAVCGLPIDTGFLELDHTVELQSGGLSRMDNYRIVHRQCNRKGRTTRIPAEHEHGQCNRCGVQLVDQQAVWCSKKCATAGRVARYRSKQRATP